MESIELYNWLRLGPKSSQNRKHVVLTIPKGFKPRHPQRESVNPVREAHGPPLQAPPARVSFHLTLDLLQSMVPHSVLQHLLRPLHPRLRGLTPSRNHLDGIRIVLRLAFLHRGSDRYHLRRERLQLTRTHLHRHPLTHHRPDPPVRRQPRRSDVQDPKRDRREIRSRRIRFHHPSDRRRTFDDVSKCCVHRLPDDGNGRCGGV